MDHRAFQVALVVKNLPANAGDIRDMGSIPGSGRSPGGGHGNPLQYSCRQNHMDRGAWWATVHSVTKSQTWLKWLSKYIRIIGLPRWLNGKESACNAGDVGSVLGLRRSPREGNDNPVQYSCLGDPTDRRAWWLMYFYTRIQPYNHHLDQYIEHYQHLKRLFQSHCHLIPWSFF